MRVVLSLVAVLWLAGCGSEEEGGGGAERAHTPRFYKKDDWPTAQERRMRADHAPTPYTSTQIRDGCPSGRRVTYELLYTGNFAMHQVMTFLDPTEKDVLVVTVLKKAGDTTSDPEPKERRSTWAELQNHGSKPAADTVLAEETITVPGGTFDCMRYTVSRSVTAKDGTVTKGEDRYWFAWDLPGPPVKFEQDVNGKLALTMTLLANEMPKSK